MVARTTITTIEDVAADIRFIDMHIAELEIESKSTFLMDCKRAHAQSIFDKMIASKQKNG